MSTDVIQLPPGRPAVTGQLTAIEQSRAVEEVRAAVFMARQFPRDIVAATAEMEEVCAMPALAGRAFYAFPRAGSSITGPTVHLMREMARIWGNVTYGVHELSRDDRKGESEMQAYAWDLQTNSRPVLGFQVPHKRDRERGNGGPQELTQMRDIYENNANQGARRLRECIEAVLPIWFVERAKELCTQTNAGDPDELPGRIGKMVGGFAALSVTEEDITRRLGRPRAAWTGQDVAQLKVVFTALQRGEVALAEAFPPEAAPPVAVTALGPAPQSEPAYPAEPAPAAAYDPAPRMFAVLGELRVTDRDERLAVCSALLHRRIDSTKDMDGADIQSVTEALVPIVGMAEEDRAAEVAGLIVDGLKLRPAGAR